MRRRTVVDEIHLAEENFPAVYDAKLIVDGMILKGIEGLTPLVDQTSKSYHIGIFAGLDSLEAGLEDYLQVTPNSKFLKDNPFAKLDLSFGKFDSPKNVLVGNGQVDKLIENESKTLYITERIEVTKRRLYFRRQDMEDYRIVYDIRFWKKTATLTDYVSLSVPPIVEDIDIALVDEGVDLVKFIRDFIKTSDRVELLKEDWPIEIPDEIKVGETVKALNILNNYDEHTTSGIRTHYDREMITVTKRLVVTGAEQEVATEKEQEADTEVKPPYVYTLTLVQHHQMYEEQSNPVVNSVSLSAFSSMNKVKDFVGDLLDSTLPHVDYKVELLVLDDSYISRCVYGPMIDAGERKTIVRGSQVIKDRYGFETGYRKEHIELRKLKLY